jgi:ferredoxin-NADP reductase
VEKLKALSWGAICESVQNGASLLVIEGIVYDVKRWILVHPGGQRVLTACMGTDAAGLFLGDDSHHHSEFPTHKHSEAAMQKLATLAVARVESLSGVADTRFRYVKLVERNSEASGSILVTFDSVGAAIPIRFACAAEQHTNDPAVDGEMLIMPGQYVQIKTQSSQHGAISRPYTMLPPEDTSQSSLFSLNVKCYSNGKMSSHLNSMALGGIIKVRGPFGRPMEAGGTSPPLVILVAAGSGITPMLQWLHYTFGGEESGLSAERMPRVALLYINDSRASIMASERLARLTHRLKGRLLVHHLLKEDEGVAGVTAEPHYIEVAVGEPRFLGVQAVDKEPSATYSEGRLDQAHMNAFVGSVLSTFGPALLGHSSSSGGDEGLEWEILRKDVSRALVCGPQGFVQAAHKMLAAVPGWQSDIHDC